MAGFTTPNHFLLSLPFLVPIITVVIAISIGHFIKKSKFKRAASQIAGLEKVLQDYQKSCGNYPTTLNELLKNQCEKTTGKLFSSLVNLPLDPWQHPYGYNPLGAHSEVGFDLWSMGPDGLEGTEDDLTNWQRFNCDGGTLHATPACTK